VKILTILKLGVTLSLTILLALAIWIFSILQDYSAIKYNSDASQKIQSAVLRITLLSGDYLLYQQNRAAQQWKNTHARLGEILESDDVNHLNKYIDLKSLKSSHAGSLKLFERIAIAVKNEEKYPDNKNLYVEQKKALSSQLLATSQRIAHVASELDSAIEVKRKDVEQQLYVLLLTVFVIFIVTLLSSWFFIASRIVLPLQLLKNHITNINLEYLNEKHLATRNDELGELIHSFNTLAADLYKTTVSKEKLQIEVNERIKSEKKLRKQENLNSAVLEGTENVVVILDTDGCVVQFNHAAENATNFSRDELIGKPIWDFVIPEEEREGVKSVFKNLKNGNNKIAANYENHWLTKDGEYRLFEWHNDVLRNDFNEITHIVAIGYDITDKRENEIEQERIQRELNQSRKMEALGKLTGGIAHDFNNMLAIILGYTELALNYAKNDADTPITNCLNQIQTSADRAKDLIAKMMVFTRAEQTGACPHQLSPLLDENIILMKSILPSTINIELYKEENIPSVSIEPVQLQQTIMNLMLNAKDAMGGSGKIKVTLGLHSFNDRECSSCHKLVSGEWVDITVSDDGKGMPKDVEARIFEPFFTTKGVGQGTGMGMSVLNAIVKANSGHIIIDSSEEKGTSFHILFPPLIPEEIERIEDNDKNHDSEIIHDNARRVLIIDDEENIADVLFELLSSHHYQCTKKTNSKEALELYLENPDAFDIIITDQTMPNVTGLGLIETIRAKGLNTPIILETGYSDKIKEDSLEYENVILLQKPVEIKNLIKNITRLIN